MEIDLDILKKDFDSNKKIDIREEEDKKVL